MYVCMYVCMYVRMCDDINLANLFFVERFSFLGGSKCIVGVILGLQVMSFVERFVILCPHSGESTIGGPLHIMQLSHTYVHTYLCSYMKFLSLAASAEVATSTHNVIPQTLYATYHSLWLYVLWAMCTYVCQLV